MDFKTLKLGICGKKRVGKNTLGDALNKFLSARNINVKQYALADELKRELDPLFLINAGVSAFTEDPTEKELVRGTLISYGTGFWRKKDPDHWIKRLEQNINASIPHVAIVMDVRFASNEAPWIQNNGGILIHLDRIDETGDFFPPAGEDEAYNDPLLKYMAHHKLIWNSYNNNLDRCYYESSKFFDQIFDENQIKTWQKLFPQITT